MSKHTDHTTTRKHESQELGDLADDARALMAATAEVAGDKVAPELTLAGWAALLQVSVALLFLPQFKHIWRWLLLLAFGASAYAGYVYPGLRSGYGWHVAGFASMAAHFTLRRWDRPMPLEAAPHEE